jgi:hypothetical protein
VQQDGAIQFQPVTSLEQLPIGVSNTQEPGTYRLHQTGQDKLFAWNHGPQGIKPLCFAPQEVLWGESKSANSGFQFTRKLPDCGPTAVIVCGPAIWRPLRSRINTFCGRELQIPITSVEESNCC